jgi:hypothetical protein
VGVLYQPDTQPYDHDAVTEKMMVSFARLAPKT